jgi:hypothetical protein
MLKRGRKPKYIHSIILEGINARELYKKYKQTKKDDTSNVVFNPIIEYKNGDSNITALTDLTTKKYQAQVFLDTFKDDRTVIMHDYVNYGCLPDRTDIWCGHCHHPFNTSPIGIPIQYVKRKIDKEQLDDSKITGENDYFLTYGIFCSFPCCLAFLKDYSHKSIFRNSKSLLYSLYYKLYNIELDVKSAPSWECLKVHGGNLTIEEFRQNFCTCNYIITPNIKRPYMVAVGRYVEEKKYGYI